MTSDKQIEANRRNAQKSTGPRTPTGKRMSSLNATTHGIRASDVVIPAGPAQESAEQFDELHEALRADLAPEGVLEELLVQQITVQYWRLRRVYRAEVVNILDSRKWEAMGREYGISVGVVDPDTPPTPCHLPATTGADRLVRYARAVEGPLYRALTELYRRQAARRAVTPGSPAETLI